ncbi:antirestriction protein ArdA [Kitasatospora sp. NPDC059800]|uniref:antirestriction protein ArdA n=1 Tax=Kitasatospora sp. NPDC059800 TaxID=3346951 RepID=UPI003669DB35
MPATLTTLDAPRVWIGCLACYNGGRLTGEWYDADTADLVAPEDLHIGATDHEELWVMDHEGFCGLLVGECSPSRAAELAELLAEIPPHERSAFAVWFSTYADDDANLSSVIEEFNDSFEGEWPSQAHFAQERAERQMSNEQEELMRTWPFNAIDWESAAMELFSSGYDSEEAPGGGVYVYLIG